MQNRSFITILLRNRYFITFLAAAFSVLVMFLATNVFVRKDNNEVLKIGFVYNADAATAYTINFIRSQRELEEMFGDKVQILMKHNLGEVESLCEQACESFVQEGCRLIFFVSYGHGPVAKKMALKYPNVQFCHMKGDLVNIGRAHV